MAQILKGDTFADNQQLTAARLNQLVDSATVTVNIITDQTPVDAGTVTASDSTIINHAGVIKEALISDIIASNIPIVTSSITGGTGSDITVTPQSSSSVVGNTYTSANGLTVVVTTLVAHGLAVNQIITISGASAGYNGLFKITAVTTLTFTYVMLIAATIGSGSCTYVKSATEKVVGNVVVTGSSFINGGQDVVGDVEVRGNFEVVGNSNFKVAPTVLGAPIPQLYEITELTVPKASWGNGNSNAANTWDALWNSATYVKDVSEIWIIEVDMKVINMSSSPSTSIVNTFPAKWKMETVLTTGGTIAITNTWVQRVEYPSNAVASISGSSCISLDAFSWKTVINKGTAFDGKFRISAKQCVPTGYANQLDGFTTISPTSAGGTSNESYWQSDATTTGLNNMVLPWNTTFRIFKYKAL